MLTALLADLSNIRGHEIVATADPRFPLSAPRTVEIVALVPNRPAQLDRLIASVDAVWLVAPETDRCLEHLATRVRRQGKVLLGSRPDTIRRASDKAGLDRLLRRHRVPYPMTRLLISGSDWRKAANEIGYPIVVKPRRGAGCDGVRLARNELELSRVVGLATHSTRHEPLLIQRFVNGIPASVSLLAHNGRAVALTVNAQSVQPAAQFIYRGGITPLDHPLRGSALRAAVRTCQAFPGLRGYVGVDVILTPSEAIVIEVNPRLTTAYLGVRKALAVNVAALALDACAGTLPAPPPVLRRVRFTAAGRTSVSALRLSSRLAS